MSQSPKWSLAENALQDDQDRTEALENPNRHAKELNEPSIVDKFPLPPYLLPILLVALTAAFVAFEMLLYAGFCLIIAFISFFYARRGKDEARKRAITEHYEQSNQRKSCSSCGFILSLGEQFCPECGRKSE